MERLISPTIRVATGADLGLLLDLGIVTFKETFAAENSAQDMAAYLAENFAPERIASELADARATFVIAELAGHPVGYAKLRDGEPDACVRGANPIELERLYVLAECIGQGVGAALMAACLQRARSAGFATLWLGVWEHNPRALNFYQKWGFTHVGSHIFQLGEDAQTDLILQKPLDLDENGTKNSSEPTVAGT